MSSIESRRNVIFKLLNMTTTEEIDEFIATNEFFKECAWKYYGAMENNAGIIKAQSPDPVGALVEKITNGMDALLVRKCWDSNIDPTSPGAPQSQKEAVAKLYGTGVANFTQSEKEIRRVADTTVRIIAEGSKERPTLTVVDWGEGQQPQDFPDTFLSIGHSNKTKINFAHGVYNQGGSACLKFCGGGYQLILSRRAQNIPNCQDDAWGFTLVRERYEQGSKAEQYEYCVMNDGQNCVIPYIRLNLSRYYPMGLLLKAGV